VLMATKRKPGTPAEYKAFSNVLQKVLKVSHSELQARLEADKQAKQEQRAAKKSAASLDSDAES
jgi:uncharacterized tellurite resistance protein B-like protein